MKWLVRLAVACAALVAACGPSPDTARRESEPAQQELRVPALTGRVNDYANVLTPDQEAALTRRLEAIETGTPLHDQVVILTTPNLGGYDMELYANTVARAWQIGQREHNNGMLIVLSLDPRRIRFETAGGVQDRMTDARSFLIQRREMIPHLAEGEENYFAALDAAAVATDAVLRGTSTGDTAIDSGQDPSVQVAGQPRRSPLANLPPGVSMVLVIGGLITILVAFASGWISPVTGAATGAVAAGIGGSLALGALAAGAGIGLAVGALIGLLVAGMRAGVIDPFMLLQIFLSGGGGGGGGFSGGGGGDFSGGGASSNY
ncbi:MAG TPA: TPM domain-containing protein [Candidatus Paceibacterota bacterium]|nr:TPM domain-containing protein [Candidatus Paceibacterota bacterium]